MTANTLARVARTPRPPYYAVTTTTQLAPGFDEPAYMAMAARLYADAGAMQGFLGLEAFFQHGASIAVSYWSGLEAIERWRDHARHQEAKTIAKAEWFGPTVTRIARVERDYGFNLKPPRQPKSET